MAATLVITASLDTTQSILQQKTQLDTTRGQHAINQVKNLLKGAGARVQGNIRVQSGGAAPVRASGTITLASVAANDTVVLGGTTLTAKASPANENEFSQAGTNTQDAAALAAKINAHSTLSQVLSATSSGAVVTVTCLIPGVIGNHFTMTQTGGTMTLSAAKLASGTGGAADAGVLYSFGL